MRYRELEKILLDKGCTIRYCKGSHVMVKYDQDTFTLTRHNIHDIVNQKELKRLERKGII